MKRNIDLFIEDILKSIRIIEKYSKNLTREKLEGDIKLQDAIVRRFEIIGEAIKNIPESFKSKYPKIPWKRISGLRDITIHAYFKVDLDIIWNIIKKDLPKLKKDIEKIKLDLE